MTDDAGDYVLGEDVLSDLWLLLEPLAEEASADLPLATPPGTPGAGGSPAMDEATLREEVIAEMDFTEAQVKKVQAMQMQETGRAFFFLVDIVYTWHYRSHLAFVVSVILLRLSSGRDLEKA